MAETDRQAAERYNEQDDEPWELGDAGKAVLAVIAVSTFWLVAMISSDDIQTQLSDAGDALGAVAALLGVGAAYYAVRGLNLQRQALEEQRIAFSSQIRAQQNAVVEDHRRQHLARLQEAYAEATTKVSMFAIRMNTAIQLIDTMTDRSEILSMQVAGSSLNDKLIDAVVACARAEFLEHEIGRITALENAMGAFAAAHIRLGEVILQQGPSDLEAVDLDCEELGHLLAQSIRTEMSSGTE